MKNYDATAIKIYKGLDAVKKRPGMYIGDVNDGSGLHHMIFEIIDNSIDEALAGFCKNIILKINTDNSITIVDDGRGIPVDIHPEEGKSAAEIILTVLHAGGKFDNSNYQFSGGLHGVGISVVNALSEKLLLKIKRNNNIYYQEYNFGIPKENIKIIDSCDNTGTEITFYPNKNIFKSTVFSLSIIKNRLKELAFLTPNLSIKIYDNRIKKSIFFQYKGGITEFVRVLNKSKQSINDDIIYFSKKIDNISADIAIQWTQSYSEKYICFYK